MRGFYVRTFRAFDVNRSNICIGCNCNWLSFIAYCEDEKMEFLIVLTFFIFGVLVPVMIYNKAKER